MITQVYRAEWRNIQSVAVKQLKQHDARNDIRFLREIAILKECRSGHVVQFLVSLLSPFSAHPLLQFPSGTRPRALESCCESRKR